MGTLPEPKDVVADALARLVTAREALEDGAVEYAGTLLRDLELDLAAYEARRGVA